MAKHMCLALLVAMAGLAMAAASQDNSLRLSPELVRAVLKHTDAVLAGTENERAMQSFPTSYATPAQNNDKPPVCKTKQLWSVRLTLTEAATDRICAEFSKKPSAQAKTECRRLADWLLQWVGDFLRGRGCPNAKGKAKCTGIQCNPYGNATATIIVKFNHLCPNCIQALQNEIGPNARDLCAINNVRPQCDANGVNSAELINASKLMDASAGDEDVDAELDGAGARSSKHRRLH